LREQFPTNLILKIRNTGNRKELLKDKRDWKGGKNNESYR